MRNNFIAIITILVVSFVITSCGSVKKIVVPPAPPKPKMINLALIKEPQANRFVNLDYGITLSISDNRASHEILKKHDEFVIDKPVVNVNPDVKSFVQESMKRYMRTTGFVMNADILTDYMLNVSINEFHISYLSGVGWTGTISLNIEVFDNNRKMVYPNTVVMGRANGNGSGNDYENASKIINQSYVNALEDIDWDRIAYFLKKANNPSLEKNKQVVGEGNTALEKTVINWSVYSSPKGADVYWRILSSTDDVKNTNRNYLGTTPYESTETFDIKGLTYNNSGNVQIEITCEKDGYLPQKKKFNLRQVLDQKDISTKFNLVEE